MKTPLMASKASKSHTIDMGITRNVPWADLPQELLSYISKFVAPNSIDILSFRAICKSWYSSSPPISPFILSVMFPLTAPKPPYTFDNRFFDLELGIPIISVTVIYLIRSPKPEIENWIMFADQLTPGRFMIRQPLSKSCYSLPFNFPRFLDVTSVRVDEISRFYSFSFHSEVSEPPSVWSEYVNKVVLKSDESMAVVLFQTGMLGVSRVKMFPQWSADSWEPVYTLGYDANDVRIDDIVNFNGKILGVDRVGRVCYFPIKEFVYSGYSRIVVSLQLVESTRKRLVESNGSLYLVVRGSVGGGSDGGVKFKVFELDEEVHKWVEVDNIGGRIFFFGLDFSFSMSPQELGGSFKKDCIVYKEGSFRDYAEEDDDRHSGNDDADEDGNSDDDGENDGDGDNDGGGDGDSDNQNDGGGDVMLLSNLRYGDLRIGVWHMEDPTQCDTIGSYPGCSNVLWPPPTWLWSIDMSKRVGDLEAAVDDILIGAPAEEFKESNAHAIFKEPTLLGDNENQPDISEIWSLARTLKTHLTEVRDLLSRLEIIKTTALSRHELCESTIPQNQVGSSSCETKEWKGSLNSIQNASKHCESSEEILSSEMKLNGMILHLEEATTKLTNTLKSLQQPPPDDVE